MVDIMNMAHFKMPRRLKKSKFRPLNISNVTCPICLSIFIEPVTMPCNHEVCMPCFQQTLNKSNLTCPMCRTRISSWARKAARENSLINHKKWQEIKKTFPDRVNNRLRGLDEDLEENTEFVTTVRSLSAPGEIRKEFEEQLKMWQEEKEKQKKLEQESFLMILKTLQCEKTKNEQQHLHLQEEQQQQQQMNDLIEFSNFPKSFLTTSHDELNMCQQINGCVEDSEPQRSTPRDSHSRTDVISRSESTDSNDSITQEFCHFKPIKIAPKTPPKQLPDGRIEEPQFIIATPRNLRKLSHVNDSNISVSCFPLCHKLSIIEADRNNTNVGKISQATETESSMFTKSNVPSNMLNESIRPILPLKPNLPLSDQTSSYHPSFAFSELNFSSRYVDKETDVNLNDRKVRSSSRESSRRSSVKSETSTHNMSFQNHSTNKTEHYKKLKTELLNINENNTRKAENLSNCIKTPTVLETKDLVAEQELIMERLKQEEVDRQIAYKLQQQFDLENQTLHRMGVREPYKLRKRLISNYRTVRRQY